MTFILNEIYICDLVIFDLRIVEKLPKLKKVAQVASNSVVEK